MPSAITLDSYSESYNRFVQQSPQQMADGLDGNIEAHEEAQRKGVGFSTRVISPHGTARSWPEIINQTMRKLSGHIKLAQYANAPTFLVANLGRLSVYVDPEQLDKRYTLPEEDTFDGKPAEVSGQLWTIANIRDFQQAILEFWRERATLQVIQATDESHFAQSRLMTLVHRSFDADDNLEAAIRAWAALNKEAAEAAQSVDDERVSYLERLLVSEGVSPMKAKPRATFIYWAYLGQSLKTGENSDGMSGTDLEQIVELFMP